MTEVFSSAIINAVAFTGSSFFFNLLHGDTERKRHDKAIEQFTKERDEWNQERTNHIDYINKRLQEEAQSEIVFQNANDALKEYYYAIGQQLTLNGNPMQDIISRSGTEPVLEDYLDEDLIAGRQTGELVFIGAGILGVGGLIYYYYGG